jgi:hypothetical protein
MEDARAPLERSFRITDIFKGQINVAIDRGVILRLVDQNRYAQSRDPIEMIVQG